MKSTRIKIIIKYSKLKFVKNILMILRFANFYYRFIKRFSQIIVFLISIIRETKKSEIKSFFIFIKKPLEAFKTFK